MKTSTEVRNDRLRSLLLLFLMLAATTFGDTQKKEYCYTCICTGLPSRPICSLKSVAITAHLPSLSILIILLLMCFLSNGNFVRNKSFMLFVDLRMYKINFSKCCKSNTMTINRAVRNRVYVYRIILAIIHSLYVTSM